VERNKNYLMDCLEGMRRHLKDNEGIYENVFRDITYLKNLIKNKSVCELISLVKKKGDEALITPI